MSTFVGRVELLLFVRIATLWDNLERYFGIDKLCSNPRKTRHRKSQVMSREQKNELGIKILGNESDDTTPFHPSIVY